MSASRKPVKTRHGRGIWVVFVTCVLTGMLFGILGGAGVIGKKLSEAVFCAAWVVGINIWHVGVIIDGEVYWRGGPLLASREKNPVKFWCFVCSSFVLFNAVGLLLLSNQITGANHGQR
jgi:hypothetical protein